MGQEIQIDLQRRSAWHGNAENLAHYRQLLRNIIRLGGLESLFTLCYGPAKDRDRAQSLDFTGATNVSLYQGESGRSLRSARRSPQVCFVPQFD